jgi:hypothetical protein
VRRPHATYEVKGSNLLCIIEQRLEEPFIPPEMFNRYYGVNLDSVTALYEQWPCYVVSVNAEGIPAPPEPSQHSQSNPMPPTYNSNPATGLSRHTPLSLILQSPWTPLRRADPTPLAEVDPQKIIASSAGGFHMWPPELRRLTAVGSVIHRLHDEFMPFLQSMTRAHMFYIYSDTDDPQYDSFLRAADSYTNPALAARFLGATRGMPDEILGQVQVLNSRLAHARAMYDFALLEALDACAVLGGVELPVWPPNPSYVGCWVGAPLRTSTEVNASYFLQARARKLERWGVPLWHQRGRRIKRRYDVGPEGRAVAGGEAAEQHHQQRLGALIRGTPPIPIKKTLVVVGSRSASRPFGPSSAPLPDDREIRAQIQRAISALVDPESAESKTFEAFNEVMKALLGPGVWSGRKHESQHHHPYAPPNPKQTSRWLRIRDGVQDCGHKGVLLAAVEIPQTWYDANSYPTDFRGVSSGLNAPSRPLELPQSAVPPMDWYVVEAAGFAKAEEMQARAVFDAYRPRGALGHRWVLCKVQNKDESGRSIRHSRYQLELLFKSIRARHEAASSIGSEFPDLLVSEATYAAQDMAWINLFDIPIDPVYIATLFSRPLPASRQQELLALAPVSSVPPARCDGVSPQQRAEAERLHLATLCHQVIFEYEGKYPPSTQSASTSACIPTSTSASLHSSITQTRGPALDMSQLTVDRFADLAFAPVPPECRLSDMGILRFQRLALILQASKRRAPFSSQLFPSTGAPYRAILHYVVSIAKQSSGLDGYSFQSGARRQRVGPWSETLKMKPDGKVEIYMAADAPLEPCNLPSRDEVDRYFEACNRENRLTRSEKRRNRQHQQSNKACGDDMSGL